MAPRLEYELEAEREGALESEGEAELEQLLRQVDQSVRGGRAEYETPRVRPLIRSICGEARRIRSRLLSTPGAARGRANVHARIWLTRTANRWPYERLRDLSRRDLDILAGCTYGVASALGEEPAPYRRLRSDIGRLLGVPAAEAEGELIGNDDRVRVADTLAIPFRFICCLEFLFTNPTTGDTHPWRGSGTLISDRHVLTAAHNVLRDPSQDVAGFPIGYRRPTRMLVAPARNDRNFPGDSSNVQTARVSPQWQATANRQTAGGNTAHIPGPRQFDFALLTLASPLGARQPLAPVTMQLPAPPLGWWGHGQFGGKTRIRAYSAELWQRLRNQTVNLSGYPADKCRHRPLIGAATQAELDACQQSRVPGMEEFRDWGSTQWRSSGSIVNPLQAPGLVTYNLDSVAGHSGGPIWLNWEGYRNLVAIHTGGFSAAANRGVRITAPLLQQLRTWMKADRVEPTF